jgi:PPOX class probable F420-dependent enzyme
MNAEERREFVRTHRTAIFGYARRKGPPSMSVVYYVMDGDDILGSTRAERAKAKAIQRDPEVSLCVLTEAWPFTYLLVYGRGRIETEGTVDLMMKIGELMSGQPVPESARPAVEAMAKKEQRVVVRITPEATFETPPRPLDAGDDGSKLTHELGRTLPWSAA